MKVRVKTLEELKNIRGLIINEFDCLVIPLGYNRFIVTPDMLEYCGKEITLSDWNGSYGSYEGILWRKELLELINEDI